MAQVFLGLGSNVQREHNLVAAIKLLGTKFSPITMSPVYSSAPIQGDGETYYNLCVGFETNLPLQDLLGLLQQWEQQLGRNRACPEEVSIDMDLLLFGDAVVNDTRQIPHPDITRYAHVLIPLLEVAPTVIHPKTGEPLAQYRHHLTDDQQLDRIDLQWK